jgi:hypothetical protein
VYTRRAYLRGVGGVMRNENGRKLF